jgi:[FeFe] hydrogenase H-cluster maturation GTPase HydF
MFGNRPHIAVVGRRNVGKSLLVNSLLGKDSLSVSGVAGTTTNSIEQIFELFPYGPVVIVDTAGIDDEGELGKQKISETIKLLSSSDFMMVVVDAREKLQNKELELFAYLDKLRVNYIIVVNKIEFGVNPELLDELRELRITHFEVSCKEKAGIDELKRKIIHQLPNDNPSQILDGVIFPGDSILLVQPSELNAPSGKLILSHVQMIREAMDENVNVILCKEKSITSTLDNLKSYPDLIIVDNNSFLFTIANIPEKVKVTTYSIILSRYKGDLPVYVQALQRLNELNNGDRILIAEACSHHNNDEISKVKIPRWLRNQTKKELKIDYYQNPEFPENILDYKLIIHCNGCLITKRAMQTRIKEAKLLDIPIINYGVFTAFMQGAIPRALIPFEDEYSIWEKVKIN